MLFFEYAHSPPISLPDSPRGDGPHGNREGRCGIHKIRKLESGNFPYRRDAEFAFCIRNIAFDDRCAQKRD